MAAIDTIHPLVLYDCDTVASLTRSLSASASHRRQQHLPFAGVPHEYSYPGASRAMADGAAGHRGGDDDDIPERLLDRKTLCISRPKPNYVLRRGDEGFREEVANWYTPAENNALEQFIQLKAKLKKANTEDFWTLATEGIAELSDAQYCFISKRMLVDDEDSAVEMPPYGQEGSCLMALAFYFNDGHGNSGNSRNMKYFVYGCPCEHMKHDKILIIPERLSEVIPNNPNKAGFVVPVEGYLAIPLTEGGKCFAHFGVMWSQEGLDRRKLSFAFIEMMFHALEDVISDGFLERGHFSKSFKAKSQLNAVIPHEAVSATQSLRPYARSLSHELRTPMQGVIGMLDVMYATVQEAVEGQSDQRVKSVLETLRANIEVVQDSSRRAVEAADNVVHAYDMNMGVPDTPVTPPSDEEDGGRQSVADKQRRPDIVVTGDNIPINFNSQTGKRRRRNSITEPAGRGSPKRRRNAGLPSPAPSRYAVQSAQNASNHMSSAVEVAVAAATSGDIETGATATPDQFVTPGLRHTNLRDMLQFLVNDLLKVGGRPESAIAQETEGGEEIEVRMRKPNGQETIKMVRWTVDPSVPETILIDEKDLAKMISCVFLNALKFTDEGSVDLRAYPKTRSGYIVITVTDTGPGIPQAFLPNLFKPFSKEDDSLTRQSEGLGLGLLVARGLARKLGGDLACVRSETSGPKRGTEFEMRIPIMPVEGISRAVTPFSSPSPSVFSSRPSRPSSLEIKAPHPRGVSQSSDLPQPIPTSAPKASRTPPTQNPPSAPIPVQPSPAYGRSPQKNDFDRSLAEKHPLTFLVVEDNKINRKLAVSMLKKMGYHDIYEAYDGADAVRKMEENRRYALHFTADASPKPPNSQDSQRSPRRASQQPLQRQRPVDVILMDLWMPFMDGYEATERILAMDFPNNGASKRPTILAFTADATGGALERAAKVGMKGFLMKPCKIRDLEKMILGYCATAPVTTAAPASVAESSE